MKGLPPSLSTLDILAQMSDAVLATDLEGRVLFWNGGAERLYGWSPVEAMGQSANDLLKTRFTDPFELILDSLLREGRWEGEITRSRKGGEPIDVLSRWSVLRDQRGIAVARMVIDTDLTETRFRFDELLKQRERELGEAHRIAKLGSWNWSRDTDEVTWSDEVFRIFARDPKLGEPGYIELLAMHAPGSRERLAAAVEEAVRVGKPYELDLEITLPDSSTRWVTARAEIETWIDGQVAKLHGTILEITERKRIEAQMALSENRYRSLVQAASQIVWITNANGEQMGSSLGWQAFTGQTDDEVRGFGWANAIHPEDREESLRTWKDCVATGAIFNIEHRLRAKDGSYRNMAVGAVPVRDASGVVVEWVGMHVDVTEQKRADAELHSVNQQLHDVLESINDGLCVIDKEWIFTYFSEQGARMLGVRAEDMVGKRVWDQFPDAENTKFYRESVRAMETQKPVHFEEFYPAPLNMWIECNCYPYGQSVSVLFRDVSNRVRTEQALRESEGRFRKLFESNLMGICIPDRFGSFKEGNDELLRMTGYTRQDLEAGLVRWDLMTPPEYAALDAAGIAEAAERGSCTPYEKEYIRKDGSRVPIFCGFALLDGSQDEYVGFVMDLTAQKRMEEALRRSEKLAMAGRFAASIAHEINNPLAAVMNTFYLALADESLRPETRAYLNLAEQELSRVAQITTQTLRFHKQSKSSAPADVAEIMESVFSLFAPRLTAKKIAITRQFDAGAQVKCFSDELRQVFANLVSNALDAMPDGGGLRVRVRKVRAWDHHRSPGVRVIIADTGQGMPKAVVERIFEPFFSTKETTGLGLGLWVTQGIVRKHRGRIAIHSRTGEDRHGTVVSLLFPVDSIGPGSPTGPNPPDTA